MQYPAPRFYPVSDKLHIDHPAGLRIGQSPPSAIPVARNASASAVNSEKDATTTPRQPCRLIGLSGLGLSGAMEPKSVRCGSSKRPFWRGAGHHCDARPCNGCGHAGNPEPVSSLSRLKSGVAAADSLARTARKLLSHLYENQIVTFCQTKFGGRGPQAETQGTPYRPASLL